MAGVADLDPAVGMLMDAAAGSRERKRLGPGRHEVDDPLVLEGQIARQLAVLLPREDQVEVLVVAQWTVGIVAIPRLAAEAPVIVGPETSAGRRWRRQVSKWPGGEILSRVDPGA